MAVDFRNYTPAPLFGEDYIKVRDFLIRLDSHNYHFGRWDWMITHGYLDKSGLSQIGLWQEGDTLAALATYDCALGKAFLLALPGYEYLKEDMLLYAKRNLNKDGAFQVLILDGDVHMQEIAARHGLLPTQDKESDAMIPIEGTELRYTLPEGFRIASMNEDYDLFKYGQALWRGFHHEADGEGAYAPSAATLEALRQEFERPNVSRDLKIAVVAPTGDFVSYCGMWQDDQSQSALVEPVATDPAYRRMGLGRAAVLEAVRRCGALGAKRAYVGSSQQFYYSIGFRPVATSTYWAQRG